MTQETKSIKKIIEITEQEYLDIKLIRNYFGENDKSAIEHLSYNVLDNLIKKYEKLPKEKTAKHKLLLLIILPFSYFNRYSKLQK